MKVTMEVDCTPIEARQFFGLPDVQPMQASVMKKLEEKALFEIERYSPEQMLKSWFSGFGQSPEQLHSLFSKMFEGGFKDRSPPS